MMEAYLGVDIGTSSAKATLVDENGTVVGGQRVPYQLKRGPGGMAELDPLALTDAAAEAISAVQSPQYRTKALTIASFGEAFVALDSAGRPIGEIVMYSDSRGSAEAKTLRERVEPMDAYRINGCGISGMYSIPKLMWMQSHDEVRYEQIASILPVADYIAFYLTGEMVANGSLAARTMALDVDSLTWSDEILGIAGVSPSLFPEITEIGTSVGKVRNELADELKLDASCQVVAGGHDQILAAIGAGLMGSEYVVDGMGSVECLIALVPDTADQSAMSESYLVRVPYLPGISKVTYGFSMGGGALLDWFAREIYYGPETSITGDSIEAMIDAAAESDGGAIVVPHINGTGTPHMDSAAAASIVGLRSNVTKENLVRALLSALNGEVILNLKHMEHAGVLPGDLIATGGGASSLRALQIKANATNRRVLRTQVLDGGALGSAIVAASGAGRFANIEEGIREWVAFSETIEPEVGTTAEEISEDPLAYETVYQLLKPIYSKKG